MLISVIIPTFSRAATLHRLLNLLAAQTLDRSQFEVVVVDDGSTDETPRLLREYAAKGVLDLRFATQPNSGQGVARNRGIELSRGEVLLFLGDDMLPAPDLLARHLAFHLSQSDPCLALLGRVEWHSELSITRFMRWLTSSGVQFRFADLRAGQQVDWRRFYTANISLKREFLGSERFDPRFHGWGFEDTELGYRLMQRGLRLIYDPALLVEHLHQISDQSLESRQESAGRNAVLFDRLHPQAGILPHGFKLLLQRVWIHLLPFTFYSRAKRAYLRGIAAAQKERLE